MKYFGGFCLDGEKEIFNPWIHDTDFSVCGFSYGAQKALEYTLVSEDRIDTLQLFSPAFFNDKDSKFKRMQLMFWNKDSTEYSKNFLANCAFPSDFDIGKFYKKGDISELEALLNYQWDQQKLQKICDKNIKIEVFLGGNDLIIDANKTKDFFDEFAQTYFLKQAGHLLFSQE